MNNIKSDKTVRNPKIRCDKCGHEFKLKPSIVKLEHISTNDDLDRTYFKCPKCKHKYTVMYQNKETKDNLSKMAELRLDNKYTADMEKSMEEYDKLYKRNLQISKDYKDIYGY